MHLNQSTYWNDKCWKFLTEQISVWFKLFAGWLCWIEFLSSRRDIDAGVLYICVKRIKSNVIDEILKGAKSSCDLALMVCGYHFMNWLYFSSSFHVWKLYLNVSSWTRWNRINYIGKYAFEIVCSAFDATVRTTHWEGKAHFKWLNLVKMIFVWQFNAIHMSSGNFVKYPTQKHTYWHFKEEEENQTSHINIQHIRFVGDKRYFENECTHHTQWKP